MAKQVGVNVVTRSLANIENRRQKGPIGNRTTTIPLTDAVGSNITGLWWGLLLVTSHCRLQMLRRSREEDTAVIVWYQYQFCGFH